MLQDVHAFRGEYIDACAQIEHWAAEVIRARPTPTSGPRKMPHLLGHKLKLVGELAADDTIFAKPARVRDLLAKLQPYIELRSHLAHAIVTVAGNGDARIYAFDLPATDPLPSLAGRFWLTPDEARRMVAALKKHHKELRDQKSRPTN